MVLSEAVSPRDKWPPACGRDRACGDGLSLMAHTCPGAAVYKQTATPADTTGDRHQRSTERGGEWCMEVKIERKRERKEERKKERKKGREGRGNVKGDLGKERAGKHKEG